MKNEERNKCDEGSAQMGREEEGEGPERVGGAAGFRNGPQGGPIYQIFGEFLERWEEIYGIV
jgi:hypothetical protein